MIIQLETTYALMFRVIDYLIFVEYICWNCWSYTTRTKVRRLLLHRRSLIKWLKLKGASRLHLIVKLKVRGVSPHRVADSKDVLNDMDCTSWIYGKDENNNRNLIWYLIGTSVMPFPKIEVNIACTISTCTTLAARVNGCVPVWSSIFAKVRERIWLKHLTSGLLPKWCKS